MITELMIGFGFVMFFWMTWHIILASNKLNNILIFILIVCLNILSGLGMLQLFNYLSMKFLLWYGVIVSISHFIYFGLSMSSGGKLLSGIMLFLLEFGLLFGLIKIFL